MGRKPCLCGCGKYPKKLTSEYWKEHRQRGKHHSGATNRKISNSKIGSLNPMFGKPGTMLGKTFSLEHNKKCSLSKIGKTGNKHTNEFKLNMSGKIIPTEKVVRKVDSLRHIISKNLEHSWRRLRKISPY